MTILQSFVLGFSLAVALMAPFTSRLLMKVKEIPCKINPGRK